MIALYIRLSRADGGEGESVSVSTQRMALESAAKRLVARGDLGGGDLGGGELMRFVDEGYSGMNMARPALQEMLALCYAGSVSAVLVSDFSRLSRDYVDLGMLVEHTFPALGVRFVSLAENHDSACADDSAEAALFRGIVSIANSCYSRDISLKVRTSVATRWHQGQHVHAFAPYGYLFDPQSPGRLRPDPVARAYVETIFELASQGVAPKDIAAALEARGIPTPATYARRAGIYGKCGCYAGQETPWNARKIRYIVGREVYAGVNVGGLTRQVGIGRGSARRATDPREQVRVEGAHEPLVTREVFERAQSCIKGGRIKRSP